MTETTITPYQASKIANAKLAELGVEKVLPPQMFYTYVKKGYIGDEKGATRTTEQATLIWLQKYVNKHNLVATVTVEDVETDES
jgi:hypothetical protein